MKKSVSNSSIERNLENNSLLFLLRLCSRLQLEKSTGERLKERAGRLPLGISNGSVLDGLNGDMTAGSIALLTSMILFANSSRVRRLSWCLLRSLGVWRTRVDRK